MDELEVNELHPFLENLYKGHPIWHTIKWLNPFNLKQEAVRVMGNDENMRNIFYALWRSRADKKREDEKKKTEKNETEKKEPETKKNENNNNNNETKNNKRKIEECTICYEREVNTVLADCGHQCICMVCGNTSFFFAHSIDLGMFSGCNKLPNVQRRHQKSNQSIQGFIQFRLI